MASEPTFDVVTEEFTVNDLSRVRSLVTRAAKFVGLSIALIDNLVAAVNEIAINAIRYAGGRGRLTIRACQNGVLVDISDSGPGLPDGLSSERPDPDALGGRGLWMARRMCSRMSISSSPSGVTVRLLAVPV
jgi:anti-sigma regulatory factor (Ser/Thr protein kinase)